jgi:hypothetical protein
VAARASLQQAKNQPRAGQRLTVPVHATSASVHPREASERVRCLRLSRTSREQTRARCERRPTAVTSSPADVEHSAADVELSIDRHRGARSVVRAARRVGRARCSAVRATRRVVRAAGRVARSTRDICKPLTPCRFRPFFRKRVFLASHDARVRSTHDAQCSARVYGPLRRCHSRVERRHGSLATGSSTARDRMAFR